MKASLLVVATAALATARAAQQPSAVAAPTTAPTQSLNGRKVVTDRVKDVTLASATAIASGASRTRGSSP